MRKTILRIYSLSAALLFSCSSALGFFPQYEHLTREDQREINSPRLFDGEYLSDKTTYELPMAWMIPWLSSDKIFQYGAGSLGPTRFLTRGRMKLNQDLGHGLRFQLSWLDRGDFEGHKNALVLEMAWRAFSFLEFSLYGEPSTLKKDDTIGVATTFYSQNNHSLRLFNTWVHFSHNKRTEENDTYTKKPASTGLVWQWLNPETDSASLLSWRWDHDTRLEDPFASHVYQYGWQELEWFIRTSLNSSNTEYLQWRLQAEKGFESDNINTDNGIERWETERYSVWLQHQSLNSIVDLYGIRYSYQEWNSAQGKVIHSDLLPHFWLPFYHGTTGTTSHKLHAGYEFTWHQGQGDPFLRSQLDTDNKLEHRGNFRYQLQMKENTFMNFLLTFDLDRFGSGETWEGGSIQFSSRF